MSNILNRLKEISSAVLYATEATDIEAVLERIAHAAKELAQTKYAALGIPDGQGGLRYFKTAGINDETYAKIAHLPTGKGLIGTVMQERHSIILDDMSDDPRSSGVPEHHPHMGSFLGVPVMAGNQLYGMLYLSDKINGDPFNEGDQLLVETLAGYAALAIASTDLREREGRIKLLEERDRIGMELHDGIIQSLYGIGMQVSLMRRMDEVTGDDLNPIVDSLNDVIDDIRQFISDLRSRGHDKVTLHQCLNRMKDRLHAPHSIDIQVDAPETVSPFTSATFESICLIVNEAMSNAVRHAEADQINVCAMLTKHSLIISVEDNGIGFDVDEITNNGGLGLGLRNMRHRARLYGGDIEIESQPEAGTTLTIMIPVGAY